MSDNPRVDGPSALDGLERQLTAHQFVKIGTRTNIDLILIGRVLVVCRT
jgi:hypothetical protein